MVYFRSRRVTVLDGIDYRPVLEEADAVCVVRQSDTAGESSNRSVYQPIRQIRVSGEGDPGSGLTAVPPRLELSRWVPGPRACCRERGADAVVDEREMLAFGVVRHPDGDELAVVAVDGGVRVDVDDLWTLGRGRARSERADEQHREENPEHETVWFRLCT